MNLLNKYVEVQTAVTHSFGNVSQQQGRRVMVSPTPGVYIPADVLELRIIRKGEH